MEIDRFIEVLKNYSESSEHEALEIVSLKDSFPYSQLLHALSARMSKDHAFVDQQNELQLAAVYAADRGVLKEVMTRDHLPTYPKKRIQKKFVKKSLSENPDEGQPQKVAAAPHDTPTPDPVESPDNEVQHFDPGSVAEEVMIDLEKLHHLRHNFEMMFPDGQAPAATPGGESDQNVAKRNAPAAIPATPQKMVTPPTPESTGPKSGQQESAKSRKQRIVEAARALEASKQAASPAQSEPKRRKRSDNIIEEIVSTKQEIVPENEKQKEQLEIIDQFIKTQPSISNKKDMPIQATSGDLTSIKAGEFSDNIVSETLVEILVKQGKNDKAIEVLKKLIWKFPQKKAYFAAQIEALKK